MEEETIFGILLEWETVTEKCQAAGAVFALKLPNRDGAYLRSILLFSVRFERNKNYTMLCMSIYHLLSHVVTVDVITSFSLLALFVSLLGDNEDKGRKLINTALIVRPRAPHSIK